MAIEFANQGNMYRMEDEWHTSRMPLLPGGIYVLRSTPMGYMFEKIKPFEMPDKFYGNAEELSKRVISTFLDRTDKNTGVLFCGEKGSGKSLTAKLIAMLLSKYENMPTILIDIPHRGPEFNSLINSIPQRCVLLFDEFEKVYGESDQQISLLSLIDGTGHGKHLMLFTVNEQYSINENFRNRPGRIFYNVQFDGVSADFVREYGVDKLNNKEHVTGLVELAMAVHSFNFDQLKALVEEMNRYNEKAADAAKLLNIRLSWGSVSLNVEIEFKDGNKFEHINNQICVDPLRNNGIRLIAWNTQLDKDGEQEFDDEGEPLNSKEYNFTVADIKSVDGANGIYVYETEEAVLTLTRPVQQQYGFDKQATTIDPGKEGKVKQVSRPPKLKPPVKSNTIALDETLEADHMVLQASPNGKAE